MREYGRIADDTEITEEHAAVPPPPAGTGGPPPSGPRPPGLLIADLWRWLALLALVIVGGLLVWVFVFHDRGHKVVVVPHVVGLPQQQAVDEVTGRGLNARVIIGSASRPRGIVVTQSPGAGTRLGRGRSVFLHVSNGHRLRQATTPPTTTQPTTGTTFTNQAATATVPNVAGQDMSSAAGQVEAAGFVAETDPGGAAGTAGSVTSQQPVGGSVSPIGGVVRLTVAVGSSRPPMNVPSVVGQKAAAARATLLHAQMTVRTVYKKGPAKNIGVVLAESPTGSQPRFTQITLTVGR